MKPVIAITMGDPGGIGPEVILKALAREDVQERLVPLVVGDDAILRSTAGKLNLPFDLEVIDAEPSEPATRPTLLLPYSTCSRLEPGQICSENGKASLTYINSGARAVLQKRAAALCTAPISKEAIRSAGADFPGHTEMLASLCGLEAVRMMMVGGGLKVVLQTIHVALSDVPGLITTGGILESLKMIRAHGVEIGETTPRIAVCGLNPHAGEGGHFGSEEIDIIAPAIEHARSEGFQVSGPLPADTVFHRAREREFDYVLAMYHDQALIPVKTLDFHGGVNVTIGLPMIRTSPDHGTAFDLAGRGIANESSMVAALKYAAELAVKTRR